MLIQGERSPVRYFATNRDRENLGRDTNRTDRIKLQKGGHHWLDMRRYMSYYLSTTDPATMPPQIVIVNSDETVFEHFISKPAIKRVIIGIHGFNVELQGALTAFSVMADTLRSTTALGPTLVTDPFVREWDPAANRLNEILDDRLNQANRDLTAFVGFSWPSNGKVLDYQSDRTEAVSSAPALANLIARIRVKNPTARVHIIAHSMGNYLTCTMLGKLVSKEINPLDVNESIQAQIERRDMGGGSQSFVDRYIMLAPDVERRHFTQCDIDMSISPQDPKPSALQNPKSEYLGPFHAGLKHLVGQTHLFYSRFDAALKASRVEKEAREVLGRVKEVFTGPDANNLWEDSLGLNPAPSVAPLNMYSHNAVAITNREINHSDYMDAQPIAEAISEIIMSAG